MTGRLLKRLWGSLYWKDGGSCSQIGGGLLKATSQAGVGPGSAFPNSWLGPPALTLVPISLLGLDSGFCTISRLPRPEKPRDRDRDSSFPAEPELRRSDSLLSFRLDLDLGPSLLTELLGAMSLSEGSAAETPAPAPAASPSASVANPPASLTLRTRFEPGKTSIHNESWVITCCAKGLEEVCKLQEC